MRKPRRNSPPWYQPVARTPTPSPPVSPYVQPEDVGIEEPRSLDDSRGFMSVESLRNSLMLQQDASPPGLPSKPLSPYATSFVPTQPPSPAHSTHSIYTKLNVHDSAREFAMSRPYSRISFKALSIPPSRAPSPAPPSLPISGVYDFEDYSVTFEVQGMLYRVHKYFFKRESPELFKKIHSYAPGDPLPLDDVSRAEFEALLEFMYSAMFKSEKITPEKWFSILHVSNMWRMSRIKAKAVKHINALEGLSPVDKIILAAKEDVDAWFLPAYSSLIERDDPLSVSEARKLFSLGEREVGSVVGMDICPLLAQARERYRTPLNRRVESAEGIVMEVFGPVATPPARSASLVGV